MAATVQTLILEGESGNTMMISCYFGGADAAGYIVPVSSYLAAGAASPKNFTIPERMRIKYLTGPATGTIRVLADGVATPMLLNVAAIIAKAADAAISYGVLRGVGPTGAKTQYSLVVEVAMAA